MKIEENKNNELLDSDVKNESAVDSLAMHDVTHDVIVAEGEALIEEQALEKEPEVVKVVKDESKLYFNSSTQEAIVLFQKENIKRTRNELYVGRILPAFEKLVENLINIYKFTSIHDSYDDLKNDCISFLFETIPKFDETRGTRAFAYFNIVAKHWLLIKTKQKSQKMKRNVSLDDPLSLTFHDNVIIEDFNTIPAQDSFLEGADSTEGTLNILYEIRSKVKSENELTCINSIITIFENIDDIDLLNKGAVLLYMRELSGLSPKQLTTTMHSIKKHYKKMAAERRAL